MRLTRDHLRVSLRLTPPSLPLVFLIGVALTVTGPVGEVEPRLRFAGMLVAAALAGTIDDVARATLAASPTALGARRVVRAASCTTGVTAWWCLLLAVGTARSPWPLPAVALSLEATALAGVGLAVSAVAQRWSVDGRGSVAGAVAVAACFGSSLLPWSWWPFRTPGYPTGSPRLIAVLVSGAAVVVAMSTDPARRWGRVVERRSHARRT